MDSGGSVYLVTLWTFGRRPIFAKAGAAALFCRILDALRRRLVFRLHAYVILPDHVRIIVGSHDHDPRSIRVIVQRLKSRFAREANARAGRLGLVWQDADHRVTLGSLDDITRRADFLHRTPTLARLAAHPRQWRWSSYRAWAGEGSAPVAVDLPPPGTAGSSG